MHAKQTSDPPQEDDCTKVHKIRGRINEEIGNGMGTSTAGLMPMMLIGVAKT
jgi:hypothetical protein